MISAWDGEASTAESKRLYDVRRVNGNRADGCDDIGQIPPTIYYARVGLELGKLVFQGQKMSPPYVPLVYAAIFPASNILHLLTKYCHTEA